VAALRDLPLGALALGSNPRKSAKDGVGERDEPVAFGGVEFVPGQTLWADEDGVVATRP
jgi:regulator of ribonuclease activity A